MEILQWGGVFRKNERHMDRVSQQRLILPRWIELFISIFDRAFYRVQVRGASNVPLTGAAILLANHLSTVDPVILRRACPRPVRFFAQGDTLPVELSASLAAGELACLFPEGHISLLGELQRFGPEVLSLARGAGVPIIPVGHDGIWGSIFSYSWRKYIWKRPFFRRLPVTVCFGPAFSAPEMVATTLRSTLLDLLAVAFADRPSLKRNLGREILTSLAGRPVRIAVIDRTSERRTLSAGKLFAVSAALSRWLRQTCARPRVGVVLPTGAGAVIANVAIVWAGKVPVNLNFTAGAATLSYSLDNASVDTVITAAAVRAKLPDFPWPEHVIDLGQAIGDLGQARILRWWIGVWLFPSAWLARWLNLPTRGNNEEVGLLFTSGSAGAPKGVGLTHRNILANCAQLSSTNVLPKAVTVLACLPVFHSFGFTVTIWYALLRRMRLVTIPSPLDSKRMIEAIREETISTVLAAPTFLRPLLKRARPEDLRSVELMVSGAEKMPLELHRAFLDTLQIELMQGYGLTETSPVTNINQDDRRHFRQPEFVQIGKRLGSVGRLLPGMAVRIVNPDTNEALPLTETGMLWLRGENIFGGYLADPEKTRLALRDGWFVTGDLARFDEDGFLFIEGRLSRFSKIGGEMVPHGAIEQKLNELLNFAAREVPVIAVVGIPDPSKGESLVLLAAEALSAENVRDQLNGAGFPNLWIPKIVKHVEKIPLLGSGKIDLAACRHLALSPEG